MVELPKLTLEEAAALHELADAGDSGRDLQPSWIERNRSHLRSLEEKLLAWSEVKGSDLRHEWRITYRGQLAAERKAA